MTLLVPALMVFVFGAGYITGLNIGKKQTEQADVGFKNVIIEKQGDQYLAYLRERPTIRQTADTQDAAVFKLAQLTGIVK